MLSSLSGEKYPWSSYPELLIGWHWAREFGVCRSREDALLPDEQSYDVKHDSMLEGR